jgi:predicted secreted Zn-dependent protease
MTLAATAVAQNPVQWTTNYYSVTGATLPEIRRSIDEARPWKGQPNTDAMTKWQVTWQFTLGQSTDGCYCRTFSTTTTIAITLPRWMAPTNAPESVKGIWARYFFALAKHESTHAQNGLSAAAELQKRSRAFGTWPDCESLKAKLNGIGEQVVQDFQRRDREYDERTRHGATEGAFLPRGERSRERPSRRQPD